MFTSFIQILFIINIIFFIISFIVYKKYKTVKYNKGKLPIVTVIVPAYNEENNIINTIESILKSSYKKIELIVINDGSTDNTSKVINDYIKQNKTKNIHFIDLKKNKGKRNALYTAINQSNSDYIITVDSDSIIAKGSIHNLIAPFLKDKNVGAVAGNIKVNNKTSLIPKLLNSAFIFGFEFLRIAQSVYGTVLCTPGAFSAYRKKAIQKDLKTWSKDIFLGHRANIGEDRALTSIVLKNNYKVVYQNNAVCYTNVPTSFDNMIKMFLRWIRGDIRESFIVFYFIKNMFHQTWNFNIYWIIYNLLMQLIWMFTPFILFIYIFGCIFHYFDTYYVIYSSFLFTIFWSIFPSYICIKNDGVKTAMYSYLYGLMNAFILFWLIPYSWFTVYNSNWLTRKKEKK